MTRNGEKYLGPTAYARLRQSREHQRIKIMRTCDLQDCVVNRISLDLRNRLVRNVGAFAEAPVGHAAPLRNRLSLDSAYSTSSASETGELFINPASAASSRKAAQRAGFVSNFPYWRWPDRRLRPMFRGLTRLVPSRLSTPLRSTYFPRLSDGTRLRPSLTNPQMPSNPKTCL